MTDELRPLSKPEMMMRDAKLKGEQIAHRFNSTKRKTALELAEVKDICRSLDIHSMPRILQLSIEDREYTSIRRKEARLLPTIETPAEDCFDHIISKGIPANLVAEGQIGVLFLPSEYGAEPRSKELVEFLEAEDQDNIQDLQGMGALLPFALAEGYPFNPEEWNLPDRPIVYLIKNVEGRYFIQDFKPTGKSLGGYPIYMVTSVEPDEQGNIPLGQASYMWSDEEVKATRELMDRFGIFYVLQEGTGDKEKRSSSTPTPQLQTSALNA